LNTGGKVQIGLDIINTLSRHYGLICPIFLDNRESITWLPEVKTQIISLIAKTRIKKYLRSLEDPAVIEEYEGDGHDFDDERFEIVSEKMEGLFIEKESEA
jgi:hypothetical protein